MDDDGYATCPRCKWVGKLRKDGTMRKHRESVDVGRFTMAGGLAQQTHGPVCEGSGEEPWDYTPPEGGYKVETTEHGGARLVADTCSVCGKEQCDNEVCGTERR